MLMLLTVDFINCKEYYSIYTTVQNVGSKKREWGGISILHGDIKLIKIYKRFDQCYNFTKDLYFCSFELLNPKQCTSFQKKTY